MKFHPIAAVALVLAAFPAVAQDAPLPDLFADVIDVRVVNVEVVVTDRKGNRIQGLEASDFELHVDREPVPIDYFTEIGDGRALATADQRVDGVPTLSAGEPVGTNYLIFVDNLFAIQQRRNRVLKRLGQDLSHLGRADRVALVAYDGRDLTLITDWTGSPERIEDALRQARRRKARGHLYAYGMGADRNDKTRRSVLAAAGTLRSFANAPGRKVMLLLIEGWATTYGSWDRLYEPLVSAANLVGYSLYPIDLPGLRGQDVRISGFGTVGAVPPFAGPIGGYAMWRGTPEQRFHDVLRFLAEETGGLPMINSFSNKALAETAEDTRSYYWLGFEPPRGEDDKLHAIRVRLPGHRGLRIRARENYLDKSKATEVSMLVEGALLLGGSPGTGSLKVSFGTPRRAGFRKLFVPMKVTVPLDDVELLHVNGQWMNELEFRMRLMDRFGEMAVPPVAKLPMVIPNEPMPGDQFVFETDLRIRKRKHRYVAAIYDPLAGELLSTSGTVGAR